MEDYLKRELKKKLSMTSFALFLSILISIECFFKWFLPLDALSTNNETLIVKAAGELYNSQMPKIEKGLKIS
jgi:hypothetical protein